MLSGDCDGCTLRVKRLNKTKVSVSCSLEVMGLLESWRIAGGQCQDPNKSAGPGFNH